MNTFTGIIMLFAGNFAPRGWAFCDGQLLSINDYPALYSLLGTAYGGNGTTTFGLPDFRSRVPVGVGQGPGIVNPYVRGQMFGQEYHTLSLAEIPSHTHGAIATATAAPNTGSAKINAKATLHADSTGATNNPKGKFLANSGSIGANEIEAYGSTADITMADGAVTVEGTVDLGSIPAPAVDVTVQYNGGNHSHYNVQPYTVVNYIICLNDIFPPRS